MRACIFALLAMAFGSASLDPPRSACAEELAPVGPWQVAEVTGIVQSRSTGAPWRPLSSGETLTEESEIRTGADGEAVLTNGTDLIRIAPNGRAVLPVPQEDGLFTLIRQKLGSLFVDVGHRPGRRFQADAPYLVVLVKGTQFTLTTNLIGGSVTVHRGMVEASTEASESVIVSAGETARVAGDGSISVGASSDSNGAGSQSSAGGRGDGPGRAPSRSRPGNDLGGDGNGDGDGSGDGDGDGDSDPDDNDNDHGGGHCPHDGKHDQEHDHQKGGRKLGPAKN